MRKAVLAGVKDANDAEWLEMLATLSGANAIKGGGVTINVAWTSQASMFSPLMSWWGTCAEPLRPLTHIHQVCMRSFFFRLCDCAPLECDFVCAQDTWSHDRTSWDC